MKAMNSKFPYIKFLITSLILILSISSHAIEFSANESAEGRPNLSTNVIPIMLGGWNADLVFPIKDSHWSLGPSFFKYNFDSYFIKLTMSGLGIRANYHFNSDPNVSSWYIGINSYLSSVRFGFFGEVTANDNHEILIGALAGYQWVFQRFNLKLGAGYSPVTPYIDLSMGIYL